MCNVLVFAGTTEGRKIASFLSQNKISTHVCVATEYGETLLPEGENITSSHTRLNETEMEELMRGCSPVFVIDATHPYAVEVTENIRQACKKTDRTYVRLLRETGEQERAEGAVYVADVEEAVEYLKSTSGNILASTGSKELVKYTAIPDFSHRVFARVLSLSSVAVQCETIGFSGKNLICMQGPFSKELNAAMIRQLHCRYLVTKMSGAAGGYQEKIDACRETGCIPVVIGRPLKEEGLSLIQCRKLLCKTFGLSPKQEIALVGIGTGSREMLTCQAAETIHQAELLIGAERMTEAVREVHHDVLKEYRSDAIGQYLDEHPEYEKVAVVLSGDVGFYSGARKLLDELKGKNVHMVCGISSMVYFMSRIGCSWDDVYLTSAHGREDYLLEDIRTHEKVFSILGTRDGVARLAEKLCFYGMNHVTITLGEKLSYPEEKILTGTPEEFLQYQGDPLSVIYVENRQKEPVYVTHGIPDSAFLRDKVPMTKEEVRTVSLAKLHLLEDSVCYDVGAGTGSVSVEMALRSVKGKVYAIEKKPLALEILKKNKEKFAADHLILVEGTAPEAFRELEPPTHAFIGGSSGNMRWIIEKILEKNPHTRFVINCIAMETVAETMKCMRELPVTDVEVIQMGVSRAKTVGLYHMMMGENPITIISCTGGRKEE